MNIRSEDSSQSALLVDCESTISNGHGWRRRRMQRVPTPYLPPRTGLAYTAGNPNGKRLVLIHPTPRLAPQVPGCNLLA